MFITFQTTQQIVERHKRYKADLNFIEIPKKWLNCKK